MPEASNPDARVLTEANRQLVLWVSSMLIVASAAMVMFHVQPTSSRNVNTASRFAVADSLVHRGTYAIDKSRYKFTVDRVKIDGHYYSSKPPLLPTYTAGVYYLYHKITGDTFKTNEPEAIFVCTAATGILSHLVMLVYLLRLSRRMFEREIAVIGCVLAGGFAYLGVGYATRLNNHTVAAATVMFGLYYAYRVAHDAAPKVRHWLLAGLAFGFLPTFDIPSGVISVSVFVYLALVDWKKTLLYFVPAALPPALVHAYMMHSIYGSVLPVQIRGLKDPTSYWSRRAGIDALSEPKHIYLFHMTFGHHGLFSMTPIFLLSVVALGKNLLRKAAHRREAVLIASFSLILFVFYVVRTRSYGGWSVGFRWLVPIMPPFVLFFAAWLDGAKLRAWKLVFVSAFFAVSSFMAQDAVSGPFQFSRWHNWIDDAPGRSRTDKHTRKGAAAQKKRRRKNARKQKP